MGVYVEKMTFPLKRSRSTEGYYFFKLYWAIGPLVPEKKIFKEFLPYMGMAAILVMWLRCGEQIFVPLNYWGSIWNLALIVPVFSEKKTIEEFSLYETM